MLNSQMLLKNLKKKIFLPKFTILNTVFLTLNISLNHLIAEDTGVMWMHKLKVLLRLNSPGINIVFSYHNL